ncbi:MAG TPA: histidinol dehydrogenase [Gaiellales bacterium]
MNAAVRTLRPSSERRDDVASAVADIVEMVRNGGDEAVRRLTLRLDGVDVAEPRVSAADMTRAVKGLAPAVRDALETLAANVRTVSAELMPRPTRVTLPQGQVVSSRPVPVRRAGVYVPGGLAAYPSSAVMAIVPAQVAGVPGIAVCSPPGPDGLPHTTALAACGLLGIEEVYAIGGAQAVAALALGTEGMPRVDLVVGPGNAYVEEAKRRLFGEVGIESLAGPSELVVVADATAPVEAIAWDLRAQLEHGPGAQSVLVSTDADVLDAVTALLPADSRAVLIETDTIDTAFAFVNAHAPEHVQLVIAGAEDSLDRVHHAGAIFVGPYAGAAFGDYIAGSNHILPTGGHSRFSSGLGPAAFVRTQEVVEVSAEACERLADSVAVLADAEGFPGHGRSAKVRAEALARETGRVG